MIQAADWMVQLALADGRRSDDQCAVLKGFGDGLELFGASEQWFGADGGTGLAKSQLIRVYDPKMEETKVTHGASGGADIEGISRCDKNHAQAVGIGGRRHGSEFSAREKAGNKNAKNCKT